MADIEGIRAIHGRLPLPDDPKWVRGWPEAYRQDVGALLAEVERLRAAVEVARAEGRRGGILAAVKVCDKRAAGRAGIYANDEEREADRCSDAIRDLLEVDDV